MNKQINDKSSETPAYLLGDDERRKIANFIYVESPILNSALDTIKECHETYQLQPEPDCVLVYGDRGTGKTSLLNNYIEQNDREYLEDGSTRVPVFSCEVVAASTVSQFYTSVLRGLGDPYPDKGTTTTKAQRIYNLLARSKTELIIIDEFHELLNSQSKQLMTNVASAIKTMINQTKIPVVLAGTKTAKYVLDNNGELFRRFITQVHLPRFTIFSKDERNNFRKFLAMFDKALPFKKVGNFAEEGMYERFFVASLGLPSGIRRLMTRASNLAIKDGSDSIESIHLIQAYDYALSSQPQVPDNPFKVSLSELKSWDVMDEFNFYKLIQ